MRNSSRSEDRRDRRGTVTCDNPGCTARVVLCAALALSACGEATAPSSGPTDGADAPSPDPGAAATVLEGRLHPALRGAPRAVEIFDLGGLPACQTQAREDGGWTCDLGARSGGFEVRVDAGAGVTLRAHVAGVEAGETRKVVVTPITHLTAAYAEARRARGEPWADALTTARRLMHGHFGGVPHHRVDPEAPTASSGAVLSEGLVSGFLLAALEHQAAEASTTPAALLTALAEDVGADGVFDGQGSQVSLRSGRIELDGQTLRGDYAEALLAFVASEANPTVFVGSDFERLAERLTNNASELFPAAPPAPVDETPPMILMIEVAVDPADPLPANTPIAGDFFVTVSARDPSGVAGFSLTHTATTPLLLGGGEAAGDEARRWRIEGATLPEGDNTFEVAVRDGAGNTARRTFEVRIDNQPPTLSATAVGRARSSTVAVSGEVADDSPIAEIRVSAPGRAPVVLEDPPARWSATVGLPCDGQDYTIEVRATDAAGNTASADVEAGCDDSPPSLQIRRTEFVDADQVVAGYSMDGQTLSYGAVDFPTPTVIASAGPHTFAKYFTRLDAWSPDLPVLGVTVGDDRGVDQTAVEYRYLVDGALVRGWTPAQTEDRVDWSVPVSYQSLDAVLATAPPGARHRVEVRAVDAAGNRAQTAFVFVMDLRSPPVWIGHCEVHPVLETYTMASGNLHEVFTVRGTTPVMRAQVRYLLDLDPASLAPRGDLRMRVTAADVRSHIDAIRLDGHPWPTTVRVPFDTAQELQCPNFGHRLWTGAIGAGTDLGCHRGTFPLLGRPWRSRAQDGLLDDDLPLPWSSEIARPGASPRYDGNDFLVRPEQPHQLDVNVVSPHLRIGGQIYTWPTALNLPAGFVPNGAAPRYRGFPQWNGEGADTVAWWASGPNPGLEVQRYATRPYVSAVSFVAGSLQYEAEHDTTGAVPRIDYGPGCGGGVVYASSL